MVVVGSLFSTWLTYPIQRLMNYAKAVRDGRRVTLPKLGSSEVATLGRTIEDMRNALEGRKYIENYVQALTHEIKSQVAAIRGAAELLHEQMPAEQREKFLHNIHTETIRIQEIVDRLLLLSAVEAKNTLDERSRIDLTQVLRNAIASLETQVAGKEIALETALPVEVCMVEGDAFLIEKALLNLLQNALAFAPLGGRIRASLERRDGRCIVTVEDNGPGIPEFAKPRVFERFFSLPRPDTGKKSSGLGLAFVREVTTLHHGSITLCDASGGGTIAALDLPAGDGTRGR